MIATPHRQSGATLLVALIMLVVLTLFMVGAMNTSTTNLRVVGNMQTKSEALAASQQAVETVLSTTQFIATPSNAIINPCGGVPNTICADVTGDGTPDYTTTLTPAPVCITAKPIKNSELNLSNTEDLGCSAGVQGGTSGIQGAMTGDSLCSNTIWEINAQTVGAATGSSVTITQGIGVRVSTDDASC